GNGMTSGNAQPNPTPIGVTGAVAIRMGYNAPSCALLAAGTVTCWNSVLEPTPVPNATGVVEIAVSSSRSGRVFMRDAAGQLTRAEYNGPAGTSPNTLAPNKPLVAMAAGDYVCGLQNDNVVACTSAAGNPPGSPLPIGMPPQGMVVEIAAGEGVQCL